MSKLISSFGLVVGIAAAAALVYAKQRSAQTGKDVMSVLFNLPAELKESQAQWQQRLKEAVEVGKKAAAEKEAEIDRELEGEEAPVTSVPDYIV
jgi:hypothetical protein